MINLSRAVPQNTIKFQNFHGLLYPVLGGACQYLKNASAPLAKSLLMIILPRFNSIKENDHKIQIKRE
ncbi:MAG: hypothetical protein C0582_04765 [Alphaproteobacteria bacterium]|mgnify:CR=1 FL=1|nr:MAG: hypothetical protein C0582_04765 [Alphaproteobacteria bacterium]